MPAAHCLIVLRPPLGTPERLLQQGNPQVSPYCPQALGAHLGWPQSCVVAGMPCPEGLSDPVPHPLRETIMGGGSDEK